ncbi:MAG: hypothetical protein OYH77_07745 [Pseudomonadota bacterium]|nr:hypothetical protein [Pseudomonadota bacterium]
MTKALTLVLVLSFHLIAIVIGCIYLGVHLDQHYPLASISWLAITLIAGLLLIAQNYYLLFRYLRRVDIASRE